MNQKTLKTGFTQAAKMVRGYASEKILEQAGSVAFISIYMALFQFLVLGVPVAGAVGIGAGIFLVILGLAFFIEGLVLGVMPIGEEAGLRLPRAVPLTLLLLFAFILGVAATVAEPAVGILKILGSSVEAWEAPLLFMMLNSRSGGLVAAISVGVGIAMVFGVLRYFFRLSLKPFLYIIIPILLLVSVAAHFDRKMVHIISLAWDTGGVTTGPVTVPLIMAMGIGISRSIGGEDKGMAGFGMITLASAFPILTVLIYGFVSAPSAPFPASRADFFAPSQRETVRRLFSSDADMEQYVRTRLSRDAADLFLGAGGNGAGEAQGGAGLRPAAGIVDPTAAKDSAAALSSSAAVPSAAAAAVPAAVPVPPPRPARMAVEQLGEAAQSILPLSLFLFLVLFALNKGRVRNKDQILLGIVFSVIGMAAFGFGIQTGLSRLGDATGRNLPVAYKAVPAPEDRMVIPDFDESLVYSAVRGDGGRERFFIVDDKDGPRFVPFDEGSFHRDARTYVHTPSRGPIFGGVLGGIAVILAFAFFMGYGATIAEPGLKTLGMTVEEVSVGAFKQKTLITSVAIGVGLGMIVGFLKILYDIPIVYLLVPCYLMLLVITAFSADDFTDIAWDSSGVTTGPITVPLVISMGLGIGGEVGGVEGFGVCAISSLFAVLFVMGTGIIVTGRRRAALKE